MNPLLAVGIALVAACSGAKEPPSPSMKPAEVRAAPAASSPQGLTSTPLFDCDDVNFAWGVEFHGVVVDDDGRIWSYDRAKGRTARDAMWDPKPAAHDPGQFDGATLRGKFLLAESHFQLPVASVQERAALIARARAGKVTSTQAANDAGGHGCVAYLWNAGKTAYESVELGSEGDVEVKNSAPEAGELAKWLADVQRALRAASPKP